MASLIGLLAAAGLRPGEALRLDRTDVDLDLGWLVVRDSKLGKTRRLPLTASTVTALEDYTRRRDECCPRPVDPAFLLAPSGRRLTGNRPR